MSFRDVGLADTASDRDIWLKCQEKQLLFITDNRNKDSPISLEATIQLHNAPNCLPVFTIADVSKFRKSRAYAERVVERLFEYLLQIDSVRGTGRLFLP